MNTIKNGLFCSAHAERTISWITTHTLVKTIERQLHLAVSIYRNILQYINPLTNCLISSNQRNLYAT
ncbi:MAG TPA: hypothetical protein VGT41_04205 [Candidatus Babeliales bacterium]|nr:hypothetical protein [Candidatus Babeliales bacterium]